MNITRIFLIILFTFGLLRYSSLPFLKEKIGIESIVNQEKKPSTDLLALLALTNISHEGTLDSIVNATQKSWLRPAGKERWESPEIYQSIDQKALPYLKNIGLIDEISPHKKTYDYAVVLGATLTSVKKRLHYLIELYKKGVIFNAIVLLGSERTLDKNIESIEQLLTGDQEILSHDKAWKYDGFIPSTEMDMMKFVYTQAEKPKGFIKIPAIFVTTPNQKNADTTVRRANTSDTIKQWISTNPKPGSCLFISNQPYVLYQHSVIRSLLPQSFIIETVGNAHYENIKIDTLLDSLARILYQESKNK